ncbi:DUF1064 domain-containing protein [Croceicoccus sp. YJ47]|uniref:DUF1064 domain-containing protein n=1 Tax=Croceicoccus sp. YJ47 TaxID=2798724 RepID=UPI0019207C24|nr:DUF1064 domain-containing protein [Croceicoccus sp. YJ47]QQN73935.1 DUF1064 domain-containing protein [Croceicoccus sp. YJ47]
MHKYRAKPTTCIHGHKHASKREAVRCVELHLLQQAGQIGDLEIEPTFTFQINGKPLKMENGQAAKYRPDFIYTENGQDIAEDVKGFVVRDFPLRAALFRALYPTIELRVTK